jgi:DNA-binding beta-propeller fold protein YncE
MAHPSISTFFRSRVLAVWVLALALASCASPPAVSPESQRLANGLAWPSPPAPAQIVYVRAISSPSDLGLTKNFFVRLFEFVFGEEPQRLVRPMAVVDVAGVLYVADPGAKGVHRFDRPSGKYRLLHGERETALPSPVGLAIGLSGDVYVTDSVLGAVFVLKPGADFATRLTLNSTLKQPTGIAFDASGKQLFVSDTYAHEIKVFALDGAYLKTIGRRGDGNGEFNFPTMLWRSDASQLLVTDSLNFRTQVFDLSGQFVSKFGKLGDGSGDAPRQKGVATDRYGHIYVVDSLLHAVQIFENSGKFLLSFGGLGQAPGEFWLPTGVFVAGDDMIYVTDSYNRRVQVFKYAGASL